MAEVYKAYQPGLNRYVAVKVMLSHMADEEEFVQRFAREALNTGKLRHPNIVQAFDFHNEDNLNFLVIEFIDGPTLKMEMKARQKKDKPFTLEEIARIFYALCSAIDYAHSHGMIHRDIKPANVMINQQGQVVLTDFGIVRTLEGTQHTATGALTGTPAYMSPEQGEGKKADERSDIYALGIMLYELVTGAVPYDADTPFAIIMKHIREPLPMPSKVNPDLPEGVEKVILKAMAKKPEDRYQSAGEMARDLRSAVGLSPEQINKPLIPVAPAPKPKEVEHDKGPITAEERIATGQMRHGGEATVMSSPAGPTIASGEQQTVASEAPTKKGLPVVPLAVGGGVLVILLIAGLFLFSGSGGGAEATATASAEAQAVALAETDEESSAGADGPTDTPTPEPPTATPTPIPPGTPQAVALAELEIRGGPGEDYQLLGFLPDGAEAEIISRDQSGEWWQVKTSLAAGEGWIRAGEEFSEAVDTGSVPIALVPTVTLEPTDTPEEPTEAPEPSPTATPEEAEPTPTPTLGPPTNTPTPAPPTDTPTPEAPPISGKLAFPVDNGAGAYDVYIYSIPDGDQIGKIENARQPNFRLDGNTLLVNGQGPGSFSENVFEASGTGAPQRVVSGSPTDMHPFYKPDGTTLTYGNPQLAFGSEGYQNYVFVQCALIPPPQDPDEFCADIAGSGVLVPAGQIGDILGTHPVWTASDQVAFKGCNTWGRGGGGSCGIYAVGSWATKRTSNGENPRKIVDGGSLVPTDSKAGLIAYHSRESGDWEAYVVGENGAGIVNISNSPNSSDGLPTISPDGQWVAFASDRAGGWAVYVAPSSGGAATKLFDFPKANPWATGDRDWTNERMSWGPS